MALALWFSVSDEEFNSRITGIKQHLHENAQGLLKLHAQIELAQRNESLVVSAWQRAANTYASMATAHKLWQSHENARKRLEYLRNLIDSRKYRLLHQDLRGMTGEQFEVFLMEVFEVLGYSVRHIGQTGDQGIDLIVTGNGRTVGIQVKRYNGGVGNAAVMQAYAGKGFHGCDSCAVITNSAFTRPARIAAARLRCCLIDGNAVPHLIIGSHNELPAIA